VFPNDFDNGLQPKVAIWPPKPEMNFDRDHRNYIGKPGVFDHDEFK